VHKMTLLVTVIQVEQSARDEEIFPSKTSSSVRAARPPGPTHTLGGYVPAAGERLAFTDLLRGRAS
jgi:hypothetical protein